MDFPQFLSYIICFTSMLFVLSAYSYLHFFKSILSSFCSCLCIFFFILALLFIYYTSNFTFSNLLPIVLLFLSFLFSLKLGDLIHIPDFSHHLYTDRPQGHSFNPELSLLLNAAIHLFLEAQQSPIWIYPKLTSFSFFVDSFPPKLLQSLQTSLCCQIPTLQSIHSIFLRVKFQTYK